MASTPKAAIARLDSPKTTEPPVKATIEMAVLDAWDVYFRRPITEEDIDRELHNRRCAA